MSNTPHIKAKIALVPFQFNYDRLVVPLSQVQVTDSQAKPVTDYVVCRVVSE